MTRAEYADYERRVDDFFKREGITNLSAVDNQADSHFSWRPCDCCRRLLGGEREMASGWNPTTGEVQEYEVCFDCLYYSEYGELDDMTMLEVER